VRDTGEPELQGRTGWLFLALSVSVAAALRIFWLTTHSQIVNSDGAEYARCAENLLRGVGFVGVWSRPEVIFPPLYPILIAIVNVLLHNSELAARIMSVVCGTLLPIPVFCLTRKLYGGHVALIAALLVSVHPIFLAISTTTFSESTYLILFVWALDWSFKALWGSDWKSGAIAGTFWGLAYLARPEAFVLEAVLVLALAGLGVVLRERRVGLWKAAAAAGIVFALLAAPYVFFLHAETGQFRLEGKSNYNYVVSRRLREGKGLTEAYYAIDNKLEVLGPGMDPVRFATYSPYPKHFGVVLRMALENAIVHVRDMDDVALTIHSYGSPLVLILGILGLFRNPWKRERLWKEIFCFATVGMLFVILLSVEWFMIRLALPLLIVLLIWAANGIDEAGKWAVGTWETLMSPIGRIPSVLRQGVGFVLIAGIFSVGLAGVIKENPFAEESNRNLPQKEAGIWLKAHIMKPGSPARPRIMSSLSIVSFYAGGDYLPLPHSDSTTAVRYCEAMAPDFVILDNDHRPYLHDWRLNGLPDSRAKLIYRIGTSPENEVDIYEWKDGPDARP
jgi:4-amino-4-deoxy-L-arabinose transferase-like glycosyltransferase